MAFFFSGESIGARLHRALFGSSAQEEKEEEDHDDETTAKRARVAGIGGETPMVMPHEAEDHLPFHLRDPDGHAAHQEAQRPQVMQWSQSIAVWLDEHGLGGVEGLPEALDGQVIDPLKPQSEAIRAIMSEDSPC